ncbi:hypothetical protein E1265_26110 [Streptomyces sp. 8K308]|uniref:hypothetical protein n=1 Tax=Streptomyces sp. 8K308 TaxID=2530388 RepID=UPI00104405F8|nr:hypothetical protein [Streptomyces sp. 8K308]TDC15887.1 hypothetical protein E1265_26110 [Streptomyces sp. 8K308]
MAAMRKEDGSAVIPAGRTPADSVRAAQLLGVALGTFRNRKAWRTLPPTLSRPEARQRIWDEEQLLAAIEGRPIPPLPTEPHPEDLLDLEEARLTIPEDQRPTAETWASYISKGLGPRPVKVFGVPHFRRAAIPAWLAARPGRGAGGGRPRGAVDRGPRRRDNDPRYKVAQQRVEQVRRRLATEQAIGAGDIAEELSISRRHAERLIAQARQAR